MQVEDHAGYKVTDIWTRWLPEYDKRSYQSKVTLCKGAIAHWEGQREKAAKSLQKVKTGPYKKRWNIRWHWCQTNIRRWENFLEDIMLAEGMLDRDDIPF